MRDWTPYKSKTVTNIDALDPVHTIAGRQYRHSEIVDIYNYWQKIKDMQLIRSRVTEAVNQIDDKNHSILDYYYSDSDRLVQQWYDKLGEWKKEREDLLSLNGYTLADFIARDLEEEYLMARDAGFQTWEEIEEEKKRLKEEAKYGPPPKDVFEYLRNQEILHGDDVDETAETSWFGEW